MCCSPYTDGVKILPALPFSQFSPVPRGIVVCLLLERIFPGWIKELGQRLSGHSLLLPPPSGRKAGQTPKDLLLPGSASQLGCFPAQGDSALPPSHIGHLPTETSSLAQAKVDRGKKFGFVT